MKVRLCEKHVEIKGKKKNKKYAEIEEAAILTCHTFGEKIEVAIFCAFLFFKSDRPYRRFESYRSKAIWFC